MTCNIDILVNKNFRSPCATLSPIFCYRKNLPQTAPPANRNGKLYEVFKNILFPYDAAA